MALSLAASGGDTVKLFDVSVETGDPCTLSYTPSPGCQVNSVKWNHTNLVVASAGDDKKVTLWRTNGQSMGTIPVAGSDFGDTVEESIFSINFSNKGSRYLCSGGSSHVVRIWDLQRKRCIKWLKGHTNTITGVSYNCKDEHLASISLSGDLIVHNLASGAKAAELKDPGKQVLRVLDYSRISRHLLVTAGDDGSVYLWDTTGRNPKVSWLKQHSAPASGVSFSPSNDKIIASVGLDKKLYTFDSGTKKQTSCISYDAPFSSLVYKDDGYILAAGTSSGRVVFYDVRGKPQPLTALRAYGNSEAVTSLSWQRSKPVLVNETCTAETALLGGALEDSILMPDPLPSTTSSSFTQSTVMTGPRNSGRLISSVESSFLAASSGGSITNALYRSSSEETPLRNSIWTGGALTRLHAPKSYNIKDDMEVFSPLVDVQPITPSLEKLWTEHDGSRKDLTIEERASLFSSRRFPPTDEGGTDVHPIFDWKFSSKQDDTRFTQLDSTPTTSSRPEDSSSITPPEAWGGEKLSDKFAHHHQAGSLSRFSMLTSGGLTSSVSSGLQQLSSSPSLTSTSSLTSSGMSFLNLRAKEISSGQEPFGGISGHIPFSALSLPLGTKSIPGQENFESTGATSLTPHRRFSTYAERISANSSLGDGTASVASPKTKKTGAETREELLNSLRSRSDISSATETGMLPTTNASLTQQPRPPSQSDMQQGSSSFTLQLFQRTLEETLSSFQRSIHEDVRNLHIEVLRQFHMQEIETSSAMNQILDNQAQLMKEVLALRKENQQLRDLM